MRKAIIVLFLVVSSSALAQEKLEILDDALHFYVIGDWGRNGDLGQQEVADAMGRMTKLIEPEFFISTGDNFYPNGVASVDDPYFISSFENIYKAAGLFEPWYLVLGNHDYRGNVQAEIDYTYKSQRWNMPARYYAKGFEEEGITAQILFTDTNPYEASYYEEGNKYREAVMDQDTLKQNKWMDSVFSVSKNMDWRIVIGHHPAYTGGKRDGETSSVARHFNPYFAKYKVHAYFAGHEHDLQVIKPSATYHFISGAGSEIRPTGRVKESLFAASEHGYMIVSLTSSKMLVQVLNEKDEVLYKQVVNK
ncbi:metallophosphoesterase [Marivirga sp. S37H4]|uniref:acid phosphatase n=1 Tax=Marivirga aurantiaca TaxID=2802615 RepID=A0A934WYD7_9BACT|nr:metallophosphoesterase [Marivirga aurantiaca]MBK6265439.1 metallophosphoesterase [Marivirga aurantiaca]